jgi:hypothetical protein
MKKAFVCEHCGDVHEGLPMDYGFDQPDEVFALSYLEKYYRVRSTPDLCTLDESRFFVRAVLPLPLPREGDRFCWGLWAEVSEQDHDAYIELMKSRTDGSILPRFDGRIANALPGYRLTLGLEVEMQFGGASDRPSLWLPKRSRHRLTIEQRNGITPARHHQLLEACGYFEK